MNTKYKIREANIEDIYVLVKHHCMMCHEIDVLENNLPDNEKIKNLEKHIPKSFLMNLTIQFAKHGS